MDEFWRGCLEKLKEIMTEKEIDSSISVLHYHKKNSVLKLLAPNQYVLEHIRSNLLDDIKSCLISADTGLTDVRLDIGSYELEKKPFNSKEPFRIVETEETPPPLDIYEEISRPNELFTFDNHIEGKSNQIARAAAINVGKEPGSFNPLYIYGGVGLGKTHLMHAAGNEIIKNFPSARVFYITSERFVIDLIKAIKDNQINEFKQLYRSVDALLIDDIQFLAKKQQSQEEFFHTYNELIGVGCQIIITSDRIPDAMNDIDDRLKSRFKGGLTTLIDVPELETRVAILLKKASDIGVHLPDNVAFFIANLVRSNVRDLEGALQQIAAASRFTQSEIDLVLAQDTFRDLMSHRKKQLTVENIQQVVAKYFKIRVSDLFSKSRSRDITRPRQFAMYFCKEYTDTSYPNIGDQFGGRDHSTVIHACKKIKELIESDLKAREDHDNLNKVFGG
ncbi:MAG: chromosomal replication initiator protein DnaA [Gammaproteobacteria bacterium]|nr:chromosomal replication initiator protein DnaA [Gammaproteobacteria bacterium]